MDIVITGADRVTRRGDVCNKIGTYLKARGVVVRSNELGSGSWRIIPGLGYVVSDHGDRKSPKDRVVPFLSGRFMVCEERSLTAY